MVSSATTVIIRGQPTPLINRGDFYYLPETYVINPELTYLYITMDGQDKICLLNTDPAVLSESVDHINIIVKNIKSEWNCFSYRTTVHEVRP